MPACLLPLSDKEVARAVWLLIQKVELLYVFVALSHAKPLCAFAGNALSPFNHRKPFKLRVSNIGRLMLASIFVCITEVL